MRLLRGQRLVAASASAVLGTVRVPGAAAIPVGRGRGRRCRCRRRRRGRRVVVAVVVVATVEVAAVQSRGSDAPQRRHAVGDQGWRQRVAAAVDEVVMVPRASSSPGGKGGCGCGLLVVVVLMRCPPRG